MTEIEYIDGELRKASRRLVNAEKRCDYESVVTETDVIDRLLDKRNRAERAMIEA